MGQIPGELTKKLAENLEITRRTVYRRIDKRWEKAGSSFSKKTAALSLAAEAGMNPREFANDGDLRELRELQKMIRKPTKTVQPAKKPRTRRKKVHALRLNDLEEELPTNLGPSKIKESMEMARTYCYLYVFENSVREFICDVMANKYGNNWWEDYVGKRVKQKVNKRIKEDKKNRWHGSRGDHPIFYADVDDYRRIMQTNWDVFAPFFPTSNGLQWVQNRIDEITKSRNVIAHMNLLGQTDRDRVKIYVDDWLKQISKG